MNIQSILILTLVLAAFVFVAYRYIKGQRRGRHCGCGNCRSCS